MKTPASVLVLGSSNIDMVIKTPHLPLPGETVLGGSFFMNQGGKGANQAVSAARLGGKVTFVSKIGNDVFGLEARKSLEAEGIDTSHVLMDPAEPTGIALITVDDKGENCIAVASGANATLTIGDIEPAAEAIRNSSILLVQLETPVDTISHAIAIAAEAGVHVILNPAPVCVLPDSIFPYITVLTPNEKEAEMLSGITVKDLDSAEKAARVLAAKGVQTVIITMGASGAFILHKSIGWLIPAPDVTVRDTTAAGDVFNGALAVALSEEKALSESVDFACRAAAVSVTRMGAQSSAPTRNEVEKAALY